MSVMISDEILQTSHMTASELMEELQSCYSSARS